MKIFRYLKNSLPSVAAIIALLIVQAFCDLSLPDYTSKIVNIGVMQGGVEESIPKKIRPATIEDLQMFMPDEDAKKLEEAYVPADGEFYSLKEMSREELASLEEAAQPAMLTVYYFRLGPENINLGGQSEGLDFDKLKTAYKAGMLQKEQILQMRDDAMEKAGTVAENMLSQAATQFVKSEYEEMGLDMEKMQTDYMINVGARMLGLTLVSVLSAVICGLLSSRTGAKIARSLRGQIYGHTLSFSSAEIDQFTTASLITRNTNDIQHIQMAITMILRMALYSPILGIGGVYKVIRANTHGLEWTIAAAVGIILLVVLILMQAAVPRFEIMQKLVDKLNQVSREILTGLSVIRAFNREKYEEDRFNGANAALKKNQLFINRTMSLMMPLMMLVMNVVSLSIIWFGAKGIDLGNLQVGDMIAFITYTMQIIMSFMVLTMMSIMLPRAVVAAGRVDEVLAARPAIKNPAKALDEKCDKSGVVRFNNVSFRYPSADEDALSGISFTAGPGATTAIIGGTGSGKSTLVNLIPRLYDVSGGSITVDGVDVRELSQEKLRSLLGFVPQKGLLFSGDVRSNIKFGGEDELSDEAMIKAAEIAQAAGFIAGREGAYESPIAQGGSNVSGGQKQRLSIARAIAKRPEILIFDDSFSALDYKTDAALRRAINENLKDATIIIVAQRISTILRADQIIVLDDGKIAGIGAHAELMENCEPYREIARSQLSQEELDKGARK
ncbi:MAG: ABC transporter ATP-binding protein/permease [Oscillospiraceae bacterium]|nr:ABC transporter ATP-binding protein/permease [Oscillospiraceae bacterium]